MSEHQPESIVESDSEVNPGTAEGVGEHVVKGMGSDGVERLEGRFGDLEGVAAAPENPDEED